MNTRAVTDRISSFRGMMSLMFFCVSSAHADPLLNSEFISTLSQEIIRVQKTLP